MLAQGEYRKYSNNFLSIGVGGRAHGMGGAVSATTSNVFSTQWNPAGLAQGEAPLCLSAMHAEWFAGILNYDFIGIAKEFNRDKRAYGALSVVRMGIDNIPNTINLIEPDGSINYDNISSFSAADYGIFLSYGRQLGQSKWDIGGSVKVINRRIGPFATAWGFGLDIGVQKHTDRWHLGIMARDVTTTFNAWSFSFTEAERTVLQQTDNLVPKSSTELTAPSLITAFARDFPVNEKNSLLIELDLEFTFDGQRNTLISSSFTSVDPRIGAEYSFNDRLFLRAGLGNIQRVADDLNPAAKNTIVQPHFGIGLNLGRLRIDYALTNVGDTENTSFSHIFSLLLDFKRSSEEATGDNF
ncbi:MAG: PorV/PorQ family protein [Saprospiraceae bacterium]|nr:PorV/PorQ family protein [Saprospiraceae bacterium]